MRFWVVIPAFAWACGCSESTTDVRRSTDVVRDGGGGGAHDASAGSALNTGSGSGQTGGRNASGGQSSGGGGAGIAGAGGAGGTTPGTGSAGNGGNPIRDAAVGLPDAGEGGACRALPRLEAPDSSQFCSAVVCKVANGWEIILEDPGGFYVGHLFWQLRVGDQVFPETRYPGPGLMRIAFGMTDQEFAGLMPGESLRAAYGRAPPLDAATLGYQGHYCGEFARP